jgi:acetoin utilization deacetylase AcuC-like enzyme
LILISAGFDACVGDVGNAKHMAGGKEMAGIDLDPEDYAWTTRKVCKDINPRFILSFLRQPDYVNSLPFVFDIEDN